MCIWPVKKEDRRCEYCCYLGGCEEYDPVYDKRVFRKAERYISLMNDILGCDIMGRSRSQEMVWGRNIVMYMLRRDGFIYSDIGEALNKNHSTVIHAVRQVEDMLRYPRIYEEEYGIWKRFNKNI